MASKSDIEILVPLEAAVYYFALIQTHELKFANFLDDPDRRREILDLCVLMLLEKKGLNLSEQQERY